MSIKRGPDGIPVDVPSIKYDRVWPSEGADGRPTDKPNVTLNLGDEPTVKTGGSSHSEGTSQPDERPSLFLDEPPTTPASRPSNTDSDPVVPPGDPKTVIVRGAKKSLEQQPIVNTVQSDAMADPVAGWLVVIAGPGQGNFLKLGYGQNSIGRSSTERVALDFGDSQVSRSGHTVVTYDLRGRQFYIQPGTGTNLTYLEDEPAPVLQSMVLKPYSHITLGSTTLRFVPLCGESFCWESVDEK